MSEKQLAYWIASHQFSHIVIEVADVISPILLGYSEYSFVYVAWNKTFSFRGEIRSNSTGNIWGCLYQNPCGCSSVIVEALVDSHLAEGKRTATVSSMSCRIPKEIADFSLLSVRVLDIYGGKLNHDSSDLRCSGLLPGKFSCRRRRNAHPGPRF